MAVKIFREEAVNIWEDKIAPKSHAEGQKKSLETLAPLMAQRAQGLPATMEK